jgi:hypothetical protein
MNELRFRLTWSDYFEAERYLLRQQKILSVNANRSCAPNIW